jgi:hypothetical protein
MDWGRRWTGVESGHVEMGKAFISDKKKITWRMAWEITIVGSETMLLY